MEEVTVDNDNGEAVEVESVPVVDKIAALKQTMANTESNGLLLEILGDLAK